MTESTPPAEGQSVPFQIGDWVKLPATYGPLANIPGEITSLSTALWRRRDSSCGEQYPRTDGTVDLGRYGKAHFDDTTTLTRMPAPLSSTQPMWSGPVRPVGRPL